MKLRVIKLGRRKERGQISLMIGLMMGTLILLFGFVINAGILINARINLQNAADMAAYAGAATQARQLNLIAALNYEMRRQYKKFLFRYYIMGSWGYSDSPQKTSNSGVRPYKTQGRGSDESISFGTPVVCIDGFRYYKNKAKNDLETPEEFCVHTAKIAGVVSPSQGSQMADYLAQTAKALTRNIKDNCNGIALRNLDVLNRWLWNVDPLYHLTESELLSASAAPPDEATKNLIMQRMIALSNTSHLARGLGIFPKNLLLGSRIEVIADYMNDAAHSGVTVDVAKSMSQRPDPFQNERTIQAFYSAYRTLGEHTFSDESSITMDELLPNRMVGLEKGFASFTVFPLVYDGKFNADTTSTSDQSLPACEARVIPVPILGLPVTYSKDPNIMTYYAVRLQAQARLLLPPGLFSKNEFTMSAYAAAQPFGSRIGPIGAQAIADKDFRREIDLEKIGVSKRTLKGSVPPELLNTLPRYAPWLPVKDNFGWENLDFQRAMANGLLRPAETAHLTSSLAELSANQLEMAYDMAMLPNPAEEGLYNIPHGVNGNSMEAFDRRYGSYEMDIPAPRQPPGGVEVSIPKGSDRRVSGKYSSMAAGYWAPLVASPNGPISPSNAIAPLQDKIEDLKAQIDSHSKSNNIPSVTAGVSYAQVIIDNLNVVKDQIANYINSLKDTAAYEGEGLTYAILRAPFTDVTEPFANSNTQFFLADPSKLRSSWVNQRNADITSHGRNGYSVKFVSLNYLRQAPAIASVAGGGNSTASASWTNRLNDAQLSALDSVSPVQH